jgi:hypothetical protein
MKHADKFLFAALVTVIALLYSFIAFLS